MKNIYTDNNVPEVFKNLKYDTPLSLNSYDSPYYAVRVSTEKAKQPFNRNGFTDPYKNIAKDNYALVQNPSKRDDIEKELIFLQMLDLIAIRGNDYYIHKNAEKFYGPNGLFNGGSVGALKMLFKTFFLPGRFWRSYYSRLYLPDTIKLSARLEQEMVEIEEEILILEDEYPTLLLEKDAQLSVKS